MKEKLLNTFGLLLLALCFVISIARILFSDLPASTKETAKPVTIRFAHWQLENGVRGTLDKIAAEYTRLHPEVKVEQLPIPESIYTNWLTTQLVGGTAPDLIEIGMGTTEERLARFFTPLTELAMTPSPYNHGTDLEGKPLRDTLFDGMEGGYRVNLLEYYGVPISGASIRMYYNLDLLREITGGEQMPKTYRELLQLCAQAQDYAQKKAVPLVPIAGSKYNAPKLMQSLFQSQTQTLVERLSPPGILGEDAIRQADQYLSGTWSLDSEEVRSGLKLMREIGQSMQPGFMQLTRDDAALLFVQRRALMISTGSWDATSIHQQTSFRIGVASIPFPSATDPVYGKYTHGALSEAGVNGGVNFGVTRGSAHPEVAKDFLLFLASRRMNQLWTDESGWIPAVLGTHASAEAAPFLPVTDGYLPGILPYLSDLFSDVNRVYNNAFHLLVGPFGSPETFVKAIKPDYTNALLSDLRRQRQNSRDLVQQEDTQFTALAWIAQENPGDANAQAQLEAFLQSASTNERKFYQTQLVIEKASPSPH